MATMTKFMTISFAFIVSLSCFSISNAQMTDIERSNWLLGVIFKLEKMRDTAVADIQKYEDHIKKCDTVISRSENIIKLAQQKGNVQAETVAHEALIKAQEEKRKNELLKQEAEKRKNKAELAKADVTAQLSKQLKIKEEPAAEKKPELTLAPYLKEGAPPVDCNEILKQHDDPKCRCLFPNRPPVCLEKGMEIRLEKDKSNLFYWNIQFVRDGKAYRNDGSYFGMHDSYDEAFNACQEDAKNKNNLDSTDIVQELNCVPQ